MEEQQHALPAMPTLGPRAHVAVFGLSAVGTTIFDVAAHGGWLGLAVGGAAAAIIASQSNKFFAPLSSSPTLTRINQTVYHQQRGPNGERTFGQRLMGIHPPMIDDYVEEALAKPKPSERDEDDNSLTTWEYDSDEGLPMPTVQQGAFTFSQVLAKGFRPDLKHIYLGTLDNGTDVIVPVEDLCHVALAGLTGNGKGNIMRLIMSQLCSIGVRVLLLNPHYAGYDQSGGEDWTPFESKNKNGEPFLQQPPLPCSEETTIAMYLEWMAQTLIPQRKALAQEYKPIGRPYFVVVDEWPDVVKECAKKKINVVEHLEKLLREGRKYGIYVVVASQDFQVKTIGVEGGGVRKCFKTVLYVGGDNATARALLGDDIAIPEKLLGSGVIMLRCKIVTSQLARVPYVDNDALYQLLGPSQLPSHILRHGVKVTAQEEKLPSVLPEVTRTIQKLQAPLQELHGNKDEQNQVSFEALCDAVVAMAGYSDEEIMRILRLDEEEYLEIVDTLNEVGSRFRSVAREVPNYAELSNSERNLTVIHGNLPKRERPPEQRVNQPTESVEDTFIPGGNDLLLSEVQQEVLKVWYRENHNVDESLAQIRNEKGQGLGGRYFRHASFVLEQAGLKKKRA